MNTDDFRRSLKSEEDRLIDLRDDVRKVEGLDDGDIIDASPEHVGAELHPAEVASEFVQKEIDLSVLERIEGELTGVERALAKLDDGTYGVCESCKESIAKERLQALPATRYCVSCEARAEEPVADSLTGRMRNALRRI